MLTESVKTPLTRKPVGFVAFIACCVAATGFAADFELALERITQANQPIAITHTGDSRLFIIEQAGRVVIFDGTAIRSTPFLDIRPLVLSGGEQGLFSVAFHSNYQANGLFFVNYTNRSGDTVVARYSVSATDPNVANPNSAVTILTIDQPFANHNGGQLQFGPDGYLYIGMGDGGSGGDPQNHAQRLDSLLGKMLRIDIDGGSPYAIPPSNPFRNNPSARPEIWSYGWRNPWRFTFDRVTGDMFIADVGQNRWEEVDFQPASSIGGENYGWRLMEGAHCFNPSSNCNPGTLVLPILEYVNGSDCSVTGGHRYRGSRFVRMQGTYFYGDYCSGKIWGATQNSNGSWTTEVLLDSSLMITTFGEDFVGELYVADHNGPIYRMKDGQARPRRRATRR